MSVKNFRVQTIYIAKGKELWGKMQQKYSYFRTVFIVNLLCNGHIQMNKVAVGNDYVVRSTFLKSPSLNIKSGEDYVTYFR